MKNESKIDELLSDLIGRWGSPDIWRVHKDYYLNELAPKIVERPGYGEERELELHLNIREELTEAEWLDLPTLIQEKREGRLRETEKQLRIREAEERAQEEEKRRLAEEKETRRKQAGMAEQRQRLFEELKNKMEEDYLRTDEFFKATCLPIISIEEYEQEKASFVQKWQKVFPSKTSMNHPPG